MYASVFEPQAAKRSSIVPAPAACGEQSVCLRKDSLEASTSTAERRVLGASLSEEIASEQRARRLALEVAALPGVGQVRRAEPPQEALSQRRSAPSASARAGRSQESPPFMALILPRLG
jgi:hypothetical protein